MFSIFVFQFHIYQNTIFLALLAAKILKGFSEEDEQNSKYFKNHAEFINFKLFDLNSNLDYSNSLSEFESLAQRSFDKYYIDNEEEALKLLLSQINIDKCFLMRNTEHKENYKETKSKNITCLIFAVSHELIKFSNHSAAKKCFNLFWYDKILPMHEQKLNTWPKVTKKNYKLKTYHDHCFFTFDSFRFFYRLCFYYLYQYLHR